MRTQTQTLIPLSVPYWQTLPAQSGARILFNSGFYSLTASINPPSYCHLVAEMQYGVSQFRPTGDFPAIDITGTNKTKIILENLYLTHNQPAYTSNLLNIKPTTTFTDSRIKNVAFYDFEHKVGSAIGMDDTLGSVYRIQFVDCFSYGFENFLNCTLASFVTTNFFMNNNRFSDCQIGFNKRLMKLTGPAGSAFDDNIFINCEMQSYAGLFAPGIMRLAILAVHYIRFIWAVWFRIFPVVHNTP